MYRIISAVLKPIIMHTREPEGLSLTAAATAHFRSEDQHTLVGRLQRSLSGSAAGVQNRLLCVRRA